MSVDHIYVVSRTDPDLKNRWSGDFDFASKIRIQLETMNPVPFLFTPIFSAFVYFYGVSSRKSLVCYRYSAFSSPAHIFRWENSQNMQYVRRGHDDK
jgi:hypothetical protein